MKKLKFKALRPFSSGTGIYNPSDKEPHEANEELVVAWEESGYCVIVDVPNDPIEPTNPPEPVDQINDLTTTDGDNYEEAQNVPDFKEMPEVAENIDDEQEKQAEPENEKQGIDFNALSYPDLKKAAKKAGIKNYNTMKKDDLVKELEKGV